MRRLQRGKSQPVQWYTLRPLFILPAILIKLGSQRYPISLRNVLGVVVDHWATRNASNTSNVDLTAPIAAFLQQRLDSRNIFAGPFTLVTRKGRLSHRFAAAILGEAKLHFIAVLNEKAVSLLVNIERSPQSPGERRGMGR